MGAIKPLSRCTRLINRRREDHMYEWTFSATADWAVGLLLVATIVSMLFV
jgi:hypothetical protein